MTPAAQVALELCKSQTDCACAECPACLSWIKALTTALTQREQAVINELLQGLFEGQTEAEWLQHAERYRGGSAESWTIGTLIQRAIALRRRAGGG